MLKRKKSKPTVQSVARITRKEKPTAPKDDIRKELEDVLANVDQWLNTPNERFHMRAPIELIGTKDERLIRQWIGAVRHGYVS